jgi:hypothetical protein
LENSVMGPRSIVLMLGLATLSVLPRGAQAYVREVTKSGVPVAWRYPCVTMQIYLGSPPPVLTADAFFAASTQAAGMWSYPTLVCTDIRLAMLAEAQASADVGHDTKNVIVFRQDTWCRQPTPVDDAGMPQPYCYPSSALAITSIFKNSKTGEILDADIEFNAVDYSWGDLEGKPDLATFKTADFQNALTHELGHVLGLDHNCFTANDAQARLNDNTGAPELDCSPTLPDAILNSTMYPSVVQSDTQRRTLSLDDEQGMCDVYPHLHDVCPVRPSDSGCSVLTTAHPQRTRTALLCTTLGLLVAALAFLRKRLRG